MNDLNNSLDLPYASVANSTYVGSISFYSDADLDQTSPTQGLHSGLPMLVPVEGQPLFLADARRARHMAAKRAFDISMSFAALVALFPLFLFVAIAIKLSSRGPVFFQQVREGYQGASFVALKFRSMRIDACDLSGVAQTVKDDPRVTAIGRLLRRTSIDELPQLFNVLMGQMTLVGPRPHVGGMKAGGVAYEQLVPYYQRRLDMPPGLTGWAQANGLRGETTSPKLARARVDHDIAYIQNFSFWLDMRIILRTVKNEFFAGSGY